jgi:hypothetical protein
VELHFFETSVTLLLVFHIENFDQLECDYYFVRNPSCFENVRKLALSYQLQNFEAVYDHADVEHDVIVRIGLVLLVLGVHEGFGGDRGLFVFTFGGRHFQILQ